MAKNRLGSVALVGLVGFVAVAATAAGCGSDGNNLTQFTGTWTYTASQGTLACPGQQTLQGILGTTKEWREGLSSALVDLSPLIFDPTISCYFAFDVKDKVATIQAGQTCGFDDGTGTGNLIPDVPVSWTFTLLSATTAEETLTTTVDTTCTLTGSGTLKKVAKN
jgi:hypothetical protein